MEWFYKMVFFIWMLPKSFIMMMNSWNCASNLCLKNNHRQWHRSFLKIVGTLSQVGDAALQKPNLPPRGVPNPNSGGSRFTARLSDLYGSNNSSGHLWEQKIYHQVIKKERIKKMISTMKNILIIKKNLLQIFEIEGPQTTNFSQQNTQLQNRPSPHFNIRGT